MRLIPYVLPILFFNIACSQKDIEQANNLTISEGFKNPIGFYDATPTFSWKLPVSDEIKGQSAYQIIVASSPDLLPNKADLWDSKKQQSDQSVWVRYNGKALQSRQKVYWQVKYRKIPAGLTEKPKVESLTTTK